MKVIRKLTSNQLKRVKMMCLAVAAAGAFNTMSASVAMAQEGAQGASIMQRPLFNGKYEMPGMKYNQYEADQITDLASNSKFSPGLSGASDALLGVASLLLCVYLFIGIALAQDILMGAIAKITSQTESVEVKNAEGKTMTVAVPLWNSSVVYLTLMAIGGALPEIFLCFMSTFSQGGRVPAEIGPMAVVGSASFNLLIVSGLSIAAVTEVKRILNMNVFLVMAAFAAFAYVWLFLVLVVISPGEIDFAEAMVTLMFYPALLVSAWVSEYLSPEERAEAEELEHNRRLVCKQNIVDAAAAQGSFAVVDLVTGASDSFEAETLRADFKICLGVEDLKDATIDELLNVIDPECPVARLALRKASKTVSEVAPVAQSDAEAQQQQNQEDEKRQAAIQQQMMIRDPSWSEQFKLAVSVDDEMTGCEAFASFLAMPWKLLFAAIPPRSYMNGWATLAACAVSICALTYVMTEVMMFMGFLLDFRGCILALIMVSLGTSINNLKSSMQSAAANKTADDVFLPTIAASAANIFVGLGLPWTIATVYRYANDQGSLVIGQYEAFDINFAVVTFLCCAAVTALVLSLRRSCLGGELGGPRFSKYLSSFMMSFLWTIFIVLNCLNCYGYFGATFMPESIQGLAASALEPVPMIKACQTENTDTCGVRMTWNPQSGLQSNSMRYRLEVMDRYQQFHPLSQLCGVQSGMMDCEVPMETFEDAPFFLEEGTPILVRASAFINNSWGSPSNVDYSGARVIGAPGRMSQVRASNVSDSSVTLTWDSVDGMGANDKYEIYFSQTGGLGDYIYWTSVSGNSFEVQNLYPNSKYYFRVRGKNPCGVCAFSEPLEVSTTSVQATTVVPNAVQRIKVQQGDGTSTCEVKIMWNRPADCDPLTTNYRVTVQAASGAMVLLHQCGSSGRAQECSVPMSELASFSYGLTAGDQIKAQVTACSTVTGNCGVSSPVSTDDVSMKDKPRQPAAPRWTNRGAAFETMTLADLTPREVRPLELQWNGSAESGTTYQVLWDFGWGGVNFWPAQTIDRVVIPANADLTLTHKVLPDQWTIQYKIRAINACGFTDSEILTVRCREETNQPGVMSPVASTLGADCDVRFTWYAPAENGGEDITAYKIEVQAANGQYQRLNSCSSTPMRGAMSCTVSMSTLSNSPFNLQSGDAILVSGKAQNANGWTNDRSAAQGGVRMMTTGLDAPHLRLEGVPSNYINLAWTDIPNANHYVVEWDQGYDWASTIAWTTYDAKTDGALTDYTRLPSMKIMHADRPEVPNGSENFRFRVKAIGGCGGANPYSNILHVCISDEPPIMPTVTTETVGCAVRINIPQATSSVDPSNIRIQIQGSDYQYYSDNLPCSTFGNSRECVVHQDILKAHPYNLRSGHLVIVRVAGENDAGWGAFSGPNTVGAPIASVPYKLAEPTVVDKQSTAVTLTWNRYFGSGPGQNFDHDYELQVCMPVVTGDCDWEHLAYVSSTTYTHTGLEAQLLYKYRVRATCVCEQAQFSEELCVELVSPPAKPEMRCPTYVNDQCRDFKLNWTNDPAANVDNYKVQVKGADNQFHDYRCEIWGDMNSCDLSTTLLMASPYNLETNDGVTTQLAAINENGSSEYEACVGTTTRIRTNACTPTNLVRDYENSKDIGHEDGGEDKLCFKWNKCVDDDTVMFKFYSQAWNLNTNRAADTTSLSMSLVTDTNRNRFCMDVPSAENNAYHMWVEAYLDPSTNCESETSESYTFRTTQGPVCTGCFDVESRQCSVIFKLPECDSMGDFIESHPLSIATKDGDYLELNSVAGLDQTERCNWNSWDKLCEVSMTVFSGAPFNLLPGDEINARTLAVNSEGVQSNPIMNLGTGGCARRPVMKQLPTTVEWNADAIVQSNKSAIHIRWIDNCAGISGCHYEVVYTFAGSSTRPQREITSSNQFRLLAPSQGVEYTFYVETCNECGTAEKSVDLSVTVCEAPGVPVCMFSNPKQCSMKVDWLMPSDTPNNLIHEYKIELAKEIPGALKQDWTWYTVDSSVCGGIGRTTCDLDMKNVLLGEYGLKDGAAVFVENDQVYARTTAIGTCFKDGSTTDRKESASPAYDNTPVTLRGGATSIDAPTCKKIDDTKEVEVCWAQPDAGGDYQYTLMWTAEEEENKARFNRVNVYEQTNPVSGETCFNYRTDAASTQYFFKVLAQNDCSYVESLSCKVDNAGIPAQPVCSTQVVDCNMEITWNPVATNGSPVTRYSIEIQDQYGFYRETTTCQNTFNNKCLVSMRELAQDYGLAEGQQIYVQIFAENAVGRSIAGRCSACEMKSLPDVVYKPRVIVDNEQIIQIQWNAASNCSSDYESDCHYEVTVSIDGVSQVYTTPSLSYTEYGIDKGASYCFQVRACNSCGVGQRSEQTCIDKCIKPITPAQPRIVNRNNDVETPTISWNYDPTSACFNMQCHYTLVITTNDGVRPRTIEGIDAMTPEINLPATGALAIEHPNLPTEIDAAVQYCYKVKCCNDCGESDFSETICTAICQDCGRITNLSQVTATENLIRVQWQGNSRQYAVTHHKEITGGVAPVKTTEIVNDRTFFEIPNPGCNSCYEFTVACITECNTETGIQSSPIKVTTEDCCQHPGNLERPNVNMISATSQVEVSWARCESGSVSGFRDDCTYDIQYTLGNGQESYFETMSVNTFNMDFVQGIDYCFRVRAKNSCAHGMWSHERCQNVCPAPEKANTPALIRKNDNEITVRWDTCQNAAGECTDCSYILEVTGPYGMVREEIIYNRNQFSVYDPSSSEDYKFRVKCNSFNCGKGEFSDYLEASICSAPDAPVCPEERCPENKKDRNGECRDNKITVQWQHATGCENVSDGDHMCHYELTYQSLDMAFPETSTVFTNDLTFTLYSPEDDKEYEFCLVACNECGKSPQSDCITIKRSICETPAVPECITSELSNCGIRVDWYKTSDGGCPIDKYNIYVNNNDGFPVLYDEDSCGRLANIQACTISMERLQRHPFFLKTGEDIKIHATAVNEAGESEQSHAESRLIKMLDTPRSLNKPSHYGKDTTGFTLAWSRVKSDDEIQVFCGADNQTPTRINTNSRATSSLSQNQRIEFAPGARSYKCFVISCNDCGCSSASETEVITLTDVPIAPQVVVFNPTTCSVRVDWQLFGNGGSPIDQLSIEIAKRNWEWAEWTGRCGNVGANSCVIDMDQLGEFSTWGLKSGDRIQIRVKAANENGWSAYSDDHTGIVRMLTAPEKMDSPTANIQGHMITVHWNNAEKEQIDVKWSSRTPRYSYASPEENMENDYTTSASNLALDTRGLNSGNYRFIIRKSNSCAEGEWSQELTVACPQCHRETNSVNEVPEPWANFVPCNPDDVNSPCHHLLQGGNPTNYLPPPASSHRPPRPLSSPGHNSGSSGSSWSNSGTASPSFNYNAPSSNPSSRGSAPVYPSTYDWGYPEPTCDFNDPNSNCFRQNVDTVVPASSNDSTYCDPRRPLLACHGNTNVNNDTAAPSTVCDSNDPNSLCFNPWNSWDDIDSMWNLPSRDFTDPRVNNDGWNPAAAVDEDCDGTDKPCHHNGSAVPAARPVEPVDEGCGPNHSGPCWHSTGSSDPYANGWETNECPEPVAPDTPTCDIQGNRGGQVHVDWTSWRLTALRDVSYEIQMSEGRYGDWRTVSKYSSRTNFIGNCMHPDGCNFRVRTETECGSVSPWSGVANSSAQTTQTPNNSMVRTFSSPTECGVIIQWDRAPSNGSRPQSLQVWIQKRSGEFSSTGVSQYCSTASETTQCTIPSAVLRASPFLLTTDDDVVAKVTVQYSSWKVTYETDSNGYDVAKLGSKPKKVTTISVEKAENSSIDVTWNPPSDEQNLQYELVWNNGVGTLDEFPQYVPLTQPYTFALRYNRGNLRPGKEYVFKVRAINSCGSGEFSEPSKLSINQAPSRPDTPVVSSILEEDKCGVKIDWNKISEGGTPITNIFIDVLKKDADGVFQPSDITELLNKPDFVKNFGSVEVGNVDMAMCPDAITEKSCFITCQTLVDDMDLAVDDVVAVKVKAMNGEGDGPWSLESNKDVKVSLTPEAMDKPGMISKTGDSITITWAALDEDKTNGQEVVSYKIGWQECPTDDHATNCADWIYSPDATDCEPSTASNNLLVSCTDYYASLYDITGLNAQKFYNIKIAAVNSCGLSEYSEILEVATTNCPIKPQDVLTTIDEADVVISWATQAEIVSWEVLFQGKNKSWTRIAECSDSLDLADPSCKLSNTKIQQETGLDAQELIIVKIRGSNSSCSGPWSDVNTGDAKIASCPEKMAAPFFDDSVAQIRKDSITINWTKLTGVQAGGEGIEVTEYVIKYTLLTDDADPVPDTVNTGDNGETNVSGSLRKWKHDGLENSQNWRYEIKANNAVGASGCAPWSDSLDAVTGQPPNKPDEPSVCITDIDDADCQPPARRMRLRGAGGGVANDVDAPKVKVSWTLAADEGITEYKVEVLDSNGDFKIHTGCDVEAAVAMDEPHCYIEMSSFWDGEFEMDQGTYITVKLSSKNNKGWSSASKWNIEGAVVQKIPSMMNPPQGLRSATSDQVDLTWNKIESPRDGGRPIETYVLKYTDEETPPTDIADWKYLTGEPGVDANYCAGEDVDADVLPDARTVCTYDDKIVKFDHVETGNTKLTYMVAARNVWGTGKFSKPNLEVLEAQKPDQIDSITVNDSGTVRLTWKAPAGNGSSIPVASYKVQIEDKEGVPQTLEKDSNSLGCKFNDPDSIKEAEDRDGNAILVCRIQMKDLLGAPFNLEYNDPIVAQVQAVNAASLVGDWRKSDDSAKVKTVPKALEAAPVRGQSTTGTVLHVQWTEMEADSDLTGGSEIIYYSVYDGEAVDGDAAIYSTIEDFYLYTQVDAEVTKSFMVTATNIYGEGEKSAASEEIKFGSVPAKLIDLKSETVDADNQQSTFTWTAPDVADDSISAYIFEILNLDTNEYVSADSALSTGTDPFADKAAQIESSILKSDFGYEDGDRIRFRGAATNEFGNSEWAYPTFAAMQAFSGLLLL